MFDYESKGRGFESRRAHHERGAEKRLFSLCFNVFKVFGKERRFSDTQINPDEFDQAIGDPLVIMDENEIISLAIPLSFQTGETAIGGVATIPEQRNKGFCKALISEMAFRILGSGKAVTLTTEKTNLSMRAAAKAIGMKEL